MGKKIKKSSGLNFAEDHKPTAQASLVVMDDDTDTTVQITSVITGESPQDVQRAARKLRDLVLADPAFGVVTERFYIVTEAIAP